jgi:hypothetical protein
VLDVLQFVLELVLDTAKAALKQAEDACYANLSRTICDEVFQ